MLPPKRDLNPCVPSRPRKSARPMSDAQEPRALRVLPSAIRLRSVDALAHARHRFSTPYHTRCTLVNGAEAALVVREDPGAAMNDDEGLPLSTRFGPALAYDCASMLLACSGVDLTQCTRTAAQAALARYAFAALEPALQAALGDPTVSENASTALRREPTFAIHVLIRLPSVRVGMRLLMTVTGLHALLDDASWHPLAGRASLPDWATCLDASLGLVAGETTLPLHECNTLACGDIVRLAATSFDVSGRTSIRIADHCLQLRWLDSLRCFKVENMKLDPTPCAPEADPGQTTGATHAAGAMAAIGTIDTAAIPVRLTFSLGALRLTMGDVARLRPGSLLELKQGLPPHVSIEANGLPIGAGELVELDGRLAVEITQWARAGSPIATS